VPEKGIPFIFEIESARKVRVCLILLSFWNQIEDESIHDNERHEHENLSKVISVDSRLFNALFVGFSCISYD
jgi:hypothetical protein